MAEEARPNIQAIPFYLSSVVGFFLVKLSNCAFLYCEENKKGRSLHSLPVFFFMQFWLTISLPSDTISLHQQPTMIKALCIGILVSKVG